MSTLKQMKVNFSTFRANKTVVRAFYDSRRKVLGTIDLPIEVGSYTFGITFKVIDILNVFSLLLEGPWVHALDAVP